MDQMWSTETKRVCTHEPQYSSYIRWQSMHPENEQAYKIRWNTGRWLEAQGRLHQVVLEVHGEKVYPHAKQPGKFRWCLLSCSHHAWRKSGVLHTHLKMASTRWDSQGTWLHLHQSGIGNAASPRTLDCHSRCVCSFWHDSLLLRYLSNEKPTRTRRSNSHDMWSSTFDKS